MVVFLESDGTNLLYCCMKYYKKRVVYSRKMTYTIIFLHSDSEPKHVSAAWRASREGSDRGGQSQRNVPSQGTDKKRVFFLFRILQGTLVFYCPIHLTSNGYKKIGIEDLFFMKIIGSVHSSMFLGNTVPYILSKGLITPSLFRSATCV